MYSPYTLPLTPFGACSSARGKEKGERRKKGVFFFFFCELILFLYRRKKKGLKGKERRGERSDNLLYLHFLLKASHLIHKREGGGKRRKRELLVISLLSFASRSEEERGKEKKRGNPRHRHLYWFLFLSCEPVIPRAGEKKEEGAPGSCTFHFRARKRSFSEEKRGKKGGGGKGAVRTIS